MYDSGRVQLPPNVPEAVADQARRELAGYYAHCSALDAAFGRLLDTLTATGRDRDTIVVFTSDHGDMLGSQGQFRKQKPWAESIRVPFLVRHPEGAGPGTDATPIDAPDLMPTLLTLCGAPIPHGVQGRDFSSMILAGEPSGIEDALLALYVPFHEWRYDNGGREYRGLHNTRYTYVRTLAGPWLLYDNVDDPAQLRNLIDDPAHAARVAELDARLTARLREVGDDFADGREILRREKVELAPWGDIAIMPSQLPEPYPDTVAESPVAGIKNWSRNVAGASSSGIEIKDLPEQDAPATPVYRRHGD